MGNKSEDFYWMRLKKKKIDGIYEITLFAIFIVELIILFG